jgi:hypothetical protein
MSRPDKNRCAVLVTIVIQFKPQSQEITLLWNTSSKGGTPTATPRNNYTDEVTIQARSRYGTWHSCLLFGKSGRGIILLDVVRLHACEGCYTFHLMAQLTATIIYGIGVEWIWVRSIRRMILRRGNQTEVPGEKLIPLSLRPPQTPRELAWDWIRDAAVKG